MNFLEKIRNSDDKIKKMWLIFFSGVSIIAVVGLWVLYVNLTMPSVANKDSQNQNNDNLAKRSKITEIEKTLYAGMIFFKEKLSAKNSILIENKPRNFILEGLEEIPKTKLP